MKQEPTRTREQGTKVWNSRENMLYKIDGCRDIVSRKQYAKIDGVMVDLFTASAIVAVYDALKVPANQEKFLSLGIVAMANMAYRLIE